VDDGDGYGDANGDRDGDKDGDRARRSIGGDEKPELLFGLTLEGLDTAVLVWSGLGAALR
jgi:hypothetical protein